MKKVQMGRQIRGQKEATSEAALLAECEDTYRELYLILHCIFAALFSQFPEQFTGRKKKAYSENKDNKVSKIKRQVKINIEDGKTICV